MGITLDTADDYYSIALVYFHNKRFRQSLDILLLPCGTERLSCIRNLALTLECYVHAVSYPHRLSWRNFRPPMNFWRKIALCSTACKIKERLINYRCCYFYLERSLIDWDGWTELLFCLKRRFYWIQTMSRSVCRLYHRRSNASNR